MIDMVLNFKKIATKIFKAFSHKYPQIYNLDVSGLDCRFYINSPVEDFRVKDWGGEKEYTFDIVDSLSGEDVFYDVGSSIGVNSISAAKKMPKGSVIAFEPEEKIVERLNKNISLNNLNNIKVLRVALGREDGTGLLSSDGADSFSPRMSSMGFTGAHEVQIRSVDSLLDHGEIFYPTVVKIDVEGMEMDVLSGMNKLLDSARKPRIIFLEIHPEFIANFGYSVEDVTNILVENGYKIVFINKTHEQLLSKFSLS